MVQQKKSEKRFAPEEKLNRLQEGEHGKVKLILIKIIDNKLGKIYSHATYES